MTDDFLSRFLGNQGRARVVRIFVFSPHESFTLPLIVKRARVSLETAKKEIRFLEQMGIIKKGKFSITLSNRRVVKGKQKEPSWTYNLEFEHARALTSFIHEISPKQYQSIVKALQSSGRLAAIILSGSFMGDPTRPVDLLVAGEALNESRLEHAIRALEPRFGREIRYATFSTPEFRYRLTIQDRLVRETVDYPHLVLLDRARFF